MSASKSTVSLNAGPVGRSERILSIDVLRGFAVLGILVMNIQSFSMIGAAYLNPYSYGDLSGANYAVWFLSHLLADSKFMTVFSLLFGAGVVLMATRREETGRPAAGVHYRRMFWLIVFGLLHGLFLWYGDILYAYGICGLVIYLFRRRSPRFLLIAGALVVGVASLLTMFWQVTLPYWPPEAIEQVEVEWWAPPPETVQTELDAYRGGWSEQQVVRAPTAIYMETNHFLTETMWRAGGLMLIGMALFKLGDFRRGALTRSFYLRMTSLGFGLGLPIVIFGVLYCNDSRLGYPLGVLRRRPVQLLGQPAVRCGLDRRDHVGVSEGRPGWDRAKRTVGRGRTDGVELLSPPDHHLHHHLLRPRVRAVRLVSRVGQALIVVAVWGLLLVFCPLWLRQFRFGPFEWLWRSLTYMKLQPMKLES